MAREIVFPHEWEPRDYQFPVWEFMESGGRRACCVWHRRTGKDLTFLNYTGAAAAQRVGLYWHVAPTLRQGKRIVWNGMRKDGRKFLDHFPDHDRVGEPGSWITRKRDDEMLLEFANGSIWQVVGAEDPDALVGPNPVGIVFTEYSVYQSARIWNLLQPILVENDGWAVFIYTARGRNHGYSLMRNAQRSERWFCEILTVEDTGIVSQEQIQELRDEGMPEFEIQQEFYCSFDAPVEGSYYGDRLMQMQQDERIGTVPWEPTAEVNTAWDLGIHDATCIWFHQQVAGQHRLIDFEWSSDVGLDVYAKLLKEKPYAYGRHLVPHDAAQRELGAGGQSRIQSAKKLGLTLQLTPKVPFRDGVDAVRNLLPRVWIDEKKCEEGLNGLRAYVRKKSDMEDPEGRPVFLDQPFHDWNSHPADALRTLAIGMPRGGWNKRSEQRTQIDLPGLV